MAIRFTKHAREKFDILARHNFVVAESQVLDTLTSPDNIDTERKPHVAQKALDQSHVLRVVFRQEGDDIIVVTFYPARSYRYEN